METDAAFPAPDCLSNHFPLFPGRLGPGKTLVSIQTLAVLDFFVIILVYFRLHLSWISNVRFLGNCEIAIILKQRTKNVEPQFLLIHFRILSAMRGRI